MSGNIGPGAFPALEYLQPLQGRRVASVSVGFGHPSILELEFDPAADEGMSLFVNAAYQVVQENGSKLPIHVLLGQVVREVTADRDRLHVAAYRAAARAQSCG